MVKVSNAVSVAHRYLVESLESRLMLAVNPIVAENQLPGTPQVQWDVGIGDPTIQGYATDISVNKGQTVNFKINDPSLAAYHLDIFRMGYYGGDGARLITTIDSAHAARINQPAPINDAATGLIDAGNWQVCASWAVPQTITSGIYFANIIREDTHSGSQIVFIVRDDSSHSDVLFQTSDSTWQAYNTWGGNSLYQGSPVGRAYKVSYNRPFATRGSTVSGRDFVFGEEYPMVRWLEANGYDVSYFTDMDADRNGALIKQHKVYMSVGHDEYWSGGQRANVEAARDAGVNLAFFSGNEAYWKTRWESSVDGSETPYRTLVTYKESLANSKIDPTSIWTGLWRDPRFSPPADGGRPENNLTGTIWTVNRGPGGETGTSFQVPSTFSNLRFWRNTAVANLAPGQTATLGDQVLGYEWDEDLDNGFRPDGLIDLSSTTQSVPQKLLDYGATTGAGTATHSLTLYRASSGALVFGAGTVQWSWGLDGIHDGPHTVTDLSMQQATVNLLADMGIQPETLATSMKLAFMSSDAIAPTSTIANLSQNQQVTAGTQVTISGNATDSGGGVVAAVEVSTDGGFTWHRATGRTTWSYSWIPSVSGPTNVKSRAVDDNLNIETPSPGVSVVVNAATTSTTGLVGAFGFNAGSGTIAVDSSGKGNNGTISGATWTTGFYGQGLLFNGSTNLVTINDANSLDLTNGMTLEAWVKPSALTDFSNIIMKERTGGLAYVLYAADGQDRPPTTYINTGGADQNALGSSELPLNTWTHLAATFDGTSLLLYVNGNLAGSQNVPGSILTSTGALRIGGNSVWGEYFKGVIDEVRIYNRPLNAVEILADMSTQVGGAMESTPPSGTISAPSPGATIAGIANVSVSASDNVLVGGVELLVNGQPVGGEDSTAPFTLSWDTRKWLNGAYTLTARVRDAAGNITLSAPVTVNVNNPVDALAPSVALSVPAGGRVSGNAVAMAVASDNIGVVGVQFRVNGILVAQEDTVAPYRVTWDSRGFADGSYTVIAQARDAAGNITQSNPVTIVIDNAAPSVISKSPETGEAHFNPSFDITATFDDSIEPRTANFEVRDSANNLVAGIIRYDDATKVLTFDPTQDLALGVSYTATLTGVQDLAGNVLTSPVSWSFTTRTAISATIWDLGALPALATSGDTDAIEVGVKFRSNIDGYVTGLRFFKGSSNIGTHVGHLWDSVGNLLGSVTFVNESSSGWQEVKFTSPIPIKANTLYVASYYAPVGNYAVDNDYFANSAYDSGRLYAYGNAEVGGNGVYRYGSGGGFPNSSFRSSNYWVDVVFSNVLADLTPPTVSVRSPSPGATGVSPTAVISATFDESIEPGSLVFELRNAANQVVSASTTYNDGTHTATLTPAASLAELSTFTVTLSGANDLAGNTISAPVTWSFTTSGPDLVPPTVIQRSPAPNVSAVAPTAVVRAQFSESIQFSTISFVLKDSTNHVVNALLTYDDSTHTALLSPGGEDDGGLPAESLLPSTTYTATLSAQDLAGNAMQPLTWSFTTDTAIGNLSLWSNTAIPTTLSANDPSPVEVGVKIQSSKDGYITGLRFYKGPGNAGTHVAHLWDAGGNLLSTATFVGETAGGWQQVNLPSAVPITAGSTYVASYYAPAGGYSLDVNYFSTVGFTNGSLQALSSPASGGNGVYHYGSGGGFPASSFSGSNYWVDVSFSNTLNIDTTPPIVTSRSPSAGATSVPVNASVTATLNETINTSTLSFILRDVSNNAVAATVSFDATSNVATLVPNSPLVANASYTVILNASDTAGNAMIPATWSFTTAGGTATPSSIWDNTATPAVVSGNDLSAVELGTKFRSSVSGFVTGVRYYKGSGNTGTHLGHLWDTAGNLLATVTFSGETSSGWQQANFNSPIAITAGQTYIISYYAPNGGYGYTNGYFATSGASSGPLVALASGVDGANGVYRYGAGGGFPSQSYNSTNYWVDVVFATTLAQDTTAPIVSAVASLGITSTGATINWTTNEQADSQVEFGLDTNYGSSTALNSTLVTNHSAVLSGLLASTQYHYRVKSRDAAGNVTVSNDFTFTTSAQNNAVVSSIWSNTAVPAVATAADSAPIEVGTKFQSSMSGYVTAIRFYKGAGNTGTHVGHLWDSTGNLLATVTFTAESASGWQQANFSTPVAIAAGQTYIVSYYAPNGGYSYSNGYFATSGATGGAITALASGVDGSNGVYSYGVGGGFPNQSYMNTNYWVDVVFTTSL